MPDDRSTTKFFFMKFPCMLALTVLSTAAWLTLAEISSYEINDPIDVRIAIGLRFLFWDGIALLVVGFLFWKTCK